MNSEKAWTFSIKRKFLSKIFITLRTKITVFYYISDTMAANLKEEMKVEFKLESSFVKEEICSFSSLENRWHMTVDDHKEDVKMKKVKKMLAIIYDIKTWWRNEIHLNLFFKVKSHNRIAENFIPLFFPVYVHKSS